MRSFIWPTDTRRVTSKMGERWGTDHNGIDIAEGGYHPIYAVADGVVTRSYTSDSYGECIMIKHTVNGQTWESVYAHMKGRSRTVFVGNKVKQGHQIGIMGNTGHSTGQHLHFELHKGRWNIDKTDKVDPLDYLDKNFGTNLTVDGKWAEKTTRGLQECLGTVVDGEISDQIRNVITEAFYGDTIDFGNGKNGSLVIKALQKKMGAKVDGLLGPETIGKLQKYLGTTCDKKLSRPSLVVKELQRRLNNGTF
ncbi:M23 family metallopeptidase [Gracilibacillus salinarum]|uniref:M23 family metallopeptidase n=1 Tax=Gracilibacillus salinarum TaxID=2932255 RepID=A0ABY4GWC4_9BACI|nr:M23 family metallopeptidase [Gracilibacillus salinarum]UOQ87397.1 M23 family metallopeptidase [Gracilibacillus salinarum]